MDFLLVPSSVRYPTAFGVRALYSVATKETCYGQGINIMMFVYFRKAMSVYSLYNSFEESIFYCRVEIELKTFLPIFAFATSYCM